MAFEPFVCNSCRNTLLRPARLASSAVVRKFASESPYRSIATTARRQWKSDTVQRSFRKHAVVTSYRAFSHSRQTLAVLLNPRKDEDGQDMLIDITPRATKRLQEIMKKDSSPNICLRVQVESGGCHGFQYLMSLTDLDKVSQEDDTVFGSDHERADESVNDNIGIAKVVMDEPSLNLLKGSKVDYTMELIGSQFKIVDNPLATSSCGCGTSFDIKA